MIVEKGHEYGKWRILFDDAESDWYSLPHRFASSSNPHPLWPSAHSIEKSLPRIPPRAIAATNLAPEHRCAQARENPAQAGVLRKGVAYICAGIP